MFSLQLWCMCLFQCLVYFSEAGQRSFWLVEMAEGEYLLSIHPCNQDMFVSCFVLELWCPCFHCLTYTLHSNTCMRVVATSRWIGAAKFLTGASTVGSLAIPIILRHAHMIDTGAMFIEFVSFFIFVCTVLCFHRVSLEDDWWSISEANQC